MDLSSVVKTLAPTLATGLFGPLGGIVAKVAADAIFPGDPAAKVSATPSGVLDAIAKMTDPADVAKLKQAELDVKKFEADNNLQLATLDVQNVENARAMYISSNAAGNKTAESLAWWLVISFLIVSVLVLAGCGWLLHAGGLPADANPNVIAGVSTLIGAIVGYFSANAQQVVGFYFGSSSGSAAKSDQLAQATQSAFAALAQPAPAPAKAPPAEIAAAQILPAFTSEFGVLDKYLKDIMARHTQFMGAVSWNMTAAGISINGAAAVGTLGEPSTVRNVWTWFSAEILAAAAEFVVPVELVVAFISVESASVSKTKDACAAARREEPGYANDGTTPDRVSVGAMQTLLATARTALNNGALTEDDLRQPKTSIRAGTAYVAKQLATTKLDPPLVAAAYNAGSLYLDDTPQNPWRLRCYPIGTGVYVTRYVQYFNDAMRVSKTDNWVSANTAPSFVKAFAG